MVKQLAIGLAVFGAVIAIPGIASAHVLKIDGTIGAVLLINPDDNPVSGDMTDYVLSFHDYQGHFSLPRCNCAVTVILQGKTIATEPLAVSSTEVSENHYRFGRPGVYTMRFTGQPKTPGAFQPFMLNYEVRVGGDRSQAQPFPILLWAGMAMGIGLILLAAYAMNYD